MFKDHRVNKRILDLGHDNIEKIYSLISKIDAIKNSLDLAKNFSPTTIQRLTESVIITSTGASNRIEASIKKLVDLKKLQRLGEGKATRYKIKK